jgi:hypothetical protein
LSCCFTFDGLYPELRRGAPSNKFHAALEAEKRDSEGEVAAQRSQPIKPPRKRTRCSHHGKSGANGPGNEDVDDADFNDNRSPSGDSDTDSDMDVDGPSNDEVRVCILFTYVCLTYSSLPKFFHPRPYLARPNESECM